MVGLDGASRLSSLGAATRRCSNTGGIGDGPGSGDQRAERHGIVTCPIDRGHVNEADRVSDSCR